MKLAQSPWPRFRGNSGASGRSLHPGPEGSKVIWTKKVTRISGEPSIGLDGTIFIPLESKHLLSLDSDGQKIWKQEFFGHRKVSLQGVTTPAIRKDGTLITATLRKVICLEPDGKIRWERIIDGLPCAPNIGPQGRIYVSGSSIDWAGMYVISPKGEAVGRDDPRIIRHWSANRSQEVTPAVVDKIGNVYVAFHANYTHPEAYSWDPADEVGEELFYACTIFNADGDRIGKFVPFYHSSGNNVPNSISVNREGIVHYNGGPFGDFVAFYPEKILALEIPDYKVFLTKYYLYESSGKSTKKVHEAVDELVLHCEWNWHDERDQNVEGKQGPAYGREIQGYPALGNKGVVWTRISKKGSRSSSDDMKKPSNCFIRIDPSKLISENRLHHDAIELSGVVKADPIIDGNGHVYVGTIKGKVHVLNEKGEEIRVIDTGFPVRALVIGPDNSLITTGNSGNICLIR